MNEFKGKEGSFIFNGKSKDRFSSKDRVIDVWYGECATITKEEAKSIVNLIAAAPLLLEALQSIENDDNSIPATIWKMRNDAIKKALS